MDFAQGIVATSNGNFGIIKSKRSNAEFAPIGAPYFVVFIFARWIVDDLMITFISGDVIR